MKTHRYRLYPDREQEAWMSRQFGCCRWVYNHFLQARVDYYAAHKDDPTGFRGKGLTLYDTCKMLTDLKKQPETGWLSEVTAQSLQQTLADLDKAYNRFFNKKSAFPTFHKRGRRDAYRVPQYFKVQPVKGVIHLPKVGDVKAVFHRPLPEEADVKYITVTRTASGRHHASVCFEVSIPDPTPMGTGVIGVDLGLKDYIVTSDKEHVPAPKFLRKAEKKLKRLQRRMCKKVKGSKGREEARRLLAVQHEKVKNKRQDFTHKLTRRLVRENQTVCVESLVVKNMVKNHCLAKSISDAGWGEFLRQLKYKGGWYGCEVRRVDRFFPSTKRCHVCGWVCGSIRLKHRHWMCGGCGACHDRDENAAENIKIFGTAGSAGTIPEGDLEENAGGVPTVGTLKPEIAVLTLG